MELEEFYTKFHEQTRLSEKANRIEYLTTRKYIDVYLKPNDKILDVGAGYGIYSLAYAKLGYEVVAVDLMKHHVEGIKQQITSDMLLQVSLGNAMDLSAYPDDYFDIVLCLGPLYHLKGFEEKLACIKECKRVCKKDGVIFYAFIGNDSCVISEQFANGNDHILENGNCDTNDYHLKDDIFSFMTLDEIHALMKHCGLVKLKEVGVDGVSELLRDKINAMDDEYYKKWLGYHFYICEKQEMLGISNHILYIARKEEE